MDNLLKNLISKKLLSVEDNRLKLFSSIDITTYSFTVDPKA